MGAEWRDLLLFIILLYICNRDSESQGCLKTHYVVEDDLKLLLPAPLPPKFWDYKPMPPQLVYAVLGNESRTSCMRGKPSTSWAPHPKTQSSWFIWFSPQLTSKPKISKHSSHASAVVSKLKALTMENEQKGSSPGVALIDGISICFFHFGIISTKILDGCAWFILNRGWGNPRSVSQQPWVPLSPQYSSLNRSFISTA